MNNFDLDQTILDLGNSATNPYWTIRNAVEGVQIFGGIGSGKTSGSGKKLAEKYLKANFGGLVLTVKPDEKKEWIKYCNDAGRLNDLIIVEPGGDRFFNFLEYETKFSASQSAITDNIVQVLKTVIRAGEEKDAGKSDDAFWENALDLLIFNVIDLCKLAYGELSVQHMYDIVQTIPRENEKLLPESEIGKFKAFQKAIYLAHKKVKKLIDAWDKTLTKEQQDGFDLDPQAYEKEMTIRVPESRLYFFLDQFFMDGFKNLSEKTRSIIDFSFSGFLFRLLREPVYSLFCRYNSNFTPDDSLKGKIILLNLPVKLYHKIGRDCQIMFKYIWQRRMEQRDVNQNDRPVFLWADEAQNFLHEHDADFQATARSSRVATVYISQNLPNYYASMGGEKSAYKVKSFLGTLNTKIFHANADIETNEYASKLIGEDFIVDKTESINYNDTPSFGSSTRKQLMRLVRPEAFIQLKTGSPRNNHAVECILHRQGDAIQNGYSFKLLTFRQKQ
ncbi:type IV secretory system conjugative DNA transfer family protein [Mucilaginibacter pedocola]|uniref:TraD/TraG TraM recognition site domain-containing protein n=1 Tax=Mucilaginibacter pedocola TaxID=1792845 RepID=A0A1S9P8T4_9SPHI|nr:TraM recognition domain-containing protein [Mucilaginibacter pedocola]OOQ57384.1 hypothetical protein BC343_14885 [Mucilaginibacter pedocola]